MKKRVLVTGGSGFLGTNLIISLVKQGYKVTSLSKKKKINFFNKKNVEQINCDISNLKKLKKKIKSSYDYIFNFSGNINHKDKTETLNAHYLGLKNLLKVINKKKLKLFIQIGSSLEYGRLKSPQREIKNCKPISYYGKAKYLASKEIFKSKLKKYVILRLYQVYGPNQKRDRLIPFVIGECLKNKKFNCSDGNQIRDFLYVEDFIKLVSLILKKKNISSGVYNIGSNNPVRVKDVIQIILDNIKKGKPHFGKTKMRKDEIMELYPDILKTKKEFKWKPETHLKEGLQKTIKFYAQK